VQKNLGDKLKMNISFFLRAEDEYFLDTDYELEDGDDDL
jgi:hypothetical protein